MLELHKETFFNISSCGEVVSYAATTVDLKRKVVNNKKKTISVEMYYFPGFPVEL